MSTSGLTPLQLRVLRAMKPVQPPWMLFGGAALIGGYANHRTTRDLDFMWCDREGLDGIPDDVRSALVAAGLPVEAMRTSPSFVRLRVVDEHETLDVDLVADPGTRPAPVTQVWDGVEVRLPSAQALLADKLCALLSRMEGRDLDDTVTLLGLGCDFSQGLDDAYEIDRGFSPVTLAWILRTWPMAKVAKLAGWDAAKTAQVDADRGRLVDRLVDAAGADKAAQPPF